MSFYIVPSTESFDHHFASPSFGRCGPAVRRTSPYYGADVPSQVDAIPRSLLSALLGHGFAQEEEEEEEDLGLIQLQYRQQYAEQVRRQEYLQEIQRRQQMLHARRQQERLLEQRRQRAREQAQREKEHLARLALYQEHQRQVQEQQRRAVAFESYQQRVVAAAIQQRRRQHALAEQARAAHRQENNVEHLAGDSMLEMISLAKQLFGGGEEAVKVTAPTNEKKEVTAEQAKSDQEMEVAPSNKSTENVNEPLAANEDAPSTSSTDASSSNDNAPINVDTPSSGVEGKSSQDRLLFTYPLPADKSVRSQIRAEDIHVSFDAPSQTIQLSGLWHNDESTSDAGNSTAKSDQGSQSSHRGRKRSRSPKHSRVSDYDEKTGEEIAETEDVDMVKEDAEVTDEQAEKKAPVTKTIRLPENVNVEGLRAEITDAGFQVWLPQQS
ncbi:hypothetical protein CBS101457_003260 [Exobasidium rhododendri]|nr:hypothetical protein CBS101457_003260 [Exobasidium rhododendri]